MDSVTRWAKVVHGQPNTNIDIGEELRNDWFDVEKAMSSNGKVKPKGSAYSLFEKAYHGKEKKVFKDRPFTFTASHFGLTDKDVPLNAYVTRVTFKVTMKVQGTIDVRVPRARFNLYGGKDIDALMEDGTGWDGSKYNHSPTGKITTKLKEVSYTMNETEFHKAGFKVNALFSDRFGVDLLWYKPNSQKSENNNIYIQSIGVTVDYVLPNHLITFDKVTDGNNPRYVDVGEGYSVKITHTNDSKADDNDKKIKIDIPSDIEVVGFTGNYNNNIWTVKGKHKSKNELILKLKNWDNGLKKISLSEKDIGNYTYYIYGVPRLTDIGDVKCYAHDIHKGHKEYVDFKVRAYSPDDNQIKFNVNVDENKPDIKVEWEIIEVNDVSINVPITDVSIDETSTDTLIVFNIPQNIAKDIMFRGYFITHETGEKTAKIEDYTCKYNVLPPYTYILSNNGVTEEDCFNLICNPNRTRSRFYRGMLETTLQTPIIECPFVHNLMEIGEGKLTASIFDKKNYIGKVQLKKITHCNPKSKLTNKLIRESGKNHLILGKEGDIDESISFTTYVRPADSVTLQGYAELDEPTPINANHDCFEGDPLNHRGWAEIESVSIEQTNPLWYKVDLDVTYITHDINTKFEIVKGKSEKGDLPELFATIFELGENLSESDVFMVDTDGGFVYDENEGEIEDNNIFTLANNQKLEIRTVKPLPSVFEIVFDWKTLKDNEDSQNKMSRIFKLIDNNTGNSVMEYEYTDLEFTYKTGLDHTPDNLELITCNTILRVMNKDMGQNPQTHPMELQCIKSGEDEGIVAEKEVWFGSSLRITVNQNKLKIVDEGFNGREIEIDNEEMINGSYSWVSEWVNRNDEGGTEDTVSYINLELKETLLNTEYSGYYSKLIVSPFPIPKKQLVFTRESKEGVIYYYEDNNEPFKYRIEPYYQFLNGTNLVTRNGISLFNLNNSYSHFYIENGLVRMGFNKYNGELYLAKYDVISKSYVTTHYFKTREDIKFQLALLSSDKITIKAGDDTYFSIWRGHPFIGVSHPTDDISFDNNFRYVYGDKIDNIEQDIPVIYNLLNTDNLLPVGIGGRHLSYKNVQVEDVDEAIPEIAVKLNIPSKCIALEPTKFNVSCSEAGTVHYLVNGDEVGTAESSNEFEYIFMTNDVFKVQAVLVGENCIGFSDVVSVNVQQRSDAPTPDPEVTTGDYKLQFVSVPSVLKYMGNEEISVKLTRGGTVVKNAVVEFQTPAETVTKTTNNDGIVSVRNNDDKSPIGKSIWGCRFYTTEKTETTKPPLVCSVFKKINMVKGEPYFELVNAPEGNIYKKDGKVQIKLCDNVGSIGQVKVVYKVNDGAKKTKTTGHTTDYGNIHFKFNKKGTYNIKLYFAGNKKYNKAKATFTIFVED